MGIWAVHLLSGGPSVPILRPLVLQLGSCSYIFRGSARGGAVTFSASRGSERKSKQRRERSAWLPSLRMRSTRRTLVPLTRTTSPSSRPTWVSSPSFRSSISHLTIVFTSSCLFLPLLESKFGFLSPWSKPINYRHLQARWDLGLVLLPLFRDFGNGGSISCISSLLCSSLKLELFYLRFRVFYWEVPNSTFVRCFHKKDPF